MHRTGLIELEAVLAVARCGGFRAAAKELGMSASSLSQAVAGLEARLGVRLFDRTTRSVAFSAAGEQFVAEVAPALGAIHGAMEAVDQHRASPSGTLSLTTAVGPARRVLSSLILEYLRRWPDMHVRLVTDNRLVDIVAQGFDAGFRIAEAAPPDMIAVPFGGPIRAVVVGAPSYFEGRPPPASPADLAAHDCIRARMSSGLDFRWEFEKRGEDLAVEVRGRLTLDDGDLIVQAARAGAGLAYLTADTVAEDLAAGRLVEVMSDWTPTYPGLCLYYPGRRHAPAKLRAFVDLVREVGRLQPHR